MKTEQASPAAPPPTPPPGTLALKSPAVPAMPPVPLPRDERKGPKVDAAKVETRRVLAMHAKRPAIKVEAIATGYYNDKIRRVGDIFLIRDMAEFSDTWMVLADKDAVERRATAAEDAARRADSSGVAADVNHPTDDTGDDNPLHA